MSQERSELQGADADTDHYLVVATLTEKLSVQRKENKHWRKTNLTDVDRLKPLCKFFNIGQE